MRLCLFVFGLLLANHVMAESTEQKPEFDSALYRAEIAKILNVVDTRGLPSFTDDLTDENRGALAYVVYEREKKGYAEVKVILQAWETVCRLYRKYPFNMEMLSLRLKYWDQGHDPNYSPFLEMAYPYIVSGEVKDRNEPWFKDMQTKFYMSFLNMLLQHKDWEERRKSGKSVPKDDRWLFLYSFENDSPSEDDVRLWASLVIHYAKETRDEPDRWQFFVNRIETDLAPGLKLFSKQECNERLAGLISQSVAANHLRSVEPEEIVKAFFRGREEGRKESEGPKLSPALEAERKLAEARAAKLSESWEVHKELCQFYARTPLRETPDYPPLQFAEPRSAFDFLVLAYYQLTVRTLTEQKDQAIKAALEMTGRALALDPQSARGYALRAIAFHLQGKGDDAETCLDTALAIDPDLDEVIRAKLMLHPPTPPRELIR